MQIRFEQDLTLTLDTTVFDEEKDEFIGGVEDFNVKLGEMYPVTAVEYTDDSKMFANVWFEKPVGVAYEIPTHQFILHDTVGANISQQSQCCGDKR